MEVNAWNVLMAMKFTTVNARNSAPEGTLHQLMAASALRAISSRTTANSVQRIRVHGTVSA